MKNEFSQWSSIDFELSKNFKKYFLWSSALRFEAEKVMNTLGSDSEILHQNLYRIHRHLARQKLKFLYALSI